MALESITEMLQKAKKGHYAVPQFNVWNLEWIKTVLSTCEEIQTPLILGVSVNGSAYMGGYKNVVSMVKNLMESMEIAIPVAIHLDHATKVEDCFKAIDAGFTSVMIDASKEVFEINLEKTKKVVQYAHEKGASVESELGRVGGQEDFIVAESAYAIPEECAQMVKETGIDALAPALGSVHGIYHGEPKLGFKQMKEIAELTNAPLVLHGGSGIPDEELKKAIACGTCKINVNTDCLIAFGNLMRPYLIEHPNELDIRKIMNSGVPGIAKVIKDRCMAFGSIGKAKE